MNAQPSAARDARVTGERRDFTALRADFPILHQSIHGKPLVYLDNAASAQRPQSVIDAMVHHEQHDHANVHRGVHTLSQRSTDAYEGAREKVRGFVNAASAAEIIFTRGTTEAINLVAASLGGARLDVGDEILLTWMEHHSNIVPWQLIAEHTGARVVPAPITTDGTLDMDAFKERLSARTKIVAVGHVSNALGTINPVAEIIQLAHAQNAVVLVDGAQAAPHLRVDVQALDCDLVAQCHASLSGRR
jgi:cysteine desulfurase/selenocysteine lyase